MNKIVASVIVAFGLVMAFVAPAYATGTEPKDYTYKTVIWQLPGTGQASQPIWPGQKYVGSVKKNSSRPSDLSDGERAHLLSAVDHLAVGNCIGYQVDVYRYEEDKDRRDVDELIRGGVLNGANDPHREPHVRTDGTTWKLVHKNGCNPDKPESTDKETREHPNCADAQVVPQKRTRPGIYEFDSTPGVHEWKRTGWGEWTPWVANGSPRNMTDSEREGCAGGQPDAKVEVSSKVTDSGSCVRGQDFVTVTNVESTVTTPYKLEGTKWVLDAANAVTTTREFTTQRELTDEEREECGKPVQPEPRFYSTERARTDCEARTVTTVTEDFRVDTVFNEESWTWVETEPVLVATASSVRKATVEECPVSTPTPTPTPTVPTETPKPTPSAPVAKPVDCEYLGVSVSIVDPRYVAELDADRDGVACEEYAVERLAQTGLDFKWFYIISAILFVIGSGLILYSNYVMRK